MAFQVSITRNKEEEEEGCKENREDIGFLCKSPEMKETKRMRRRKDNMMTPHERELPAAITTR